MESITCAFFVVSAQKRRKREMSVPPKKTANSVCVCVRERERGKRQERETDLLLIREGFISEIVFFQLSHVIAKATRSRLDNIIKSVFFCM